MDKTKEIYTFPVLENTINTLSNVSLGPCFSFIFL
jgi:hypothetical protein